MAFKLIPPPGLDVVVSISLNEAWEMLFARKAVADDGAKFGLVLPRRSAAVFDGESRLDWTHEIPKRKKEGSVLRGRRVSVTFRKINTPGR
jgi:alkylated DNA repair dioxygenase AlkB